MHCFEKILILLDVFQFWSSVEKRSFHQEQPPCTVSQWMTDRLKKQGGINAAKTLLHFPSAFILLETREGKAVINELRHLIEAQNAEDEMQDCEFLIEEDIASTNRY